jgi:chaperone BCS1
MTTNYPENLDSALIRPGCVDLQVRFTLATHEQIRAIFTRMYSKEHDARTNNEAALSRQANSPSALNPACTSGSRNDNYSGSLDTVARLAPEQLAELAHQFVEQLPDVTFSPAEIQGYLLMKKMDPLGAVAGVGEWRDKLLEVTRKGRKVIDSE